jgi:hypothetical protein
MSEDSAAQAWRASCPKGEPHVSTLGSVIRWSHCAFRGQRISPVPQAAHSHQAH